MYVRRASFVLALALAALAPSRATAAPPAVGGTPGRWTVLLGFEDGDGDAGLSLRGDLEFPQRPLSSVVGWSIVGSLGYTRFHDEWMDVWWDERWESSGNVLKGMAAARFTFAVSDAIRPYADAGLGLYYGSWEYEWQQLSYPYAGYSEDDGEAGIVMRFAAGVTFQLSPTFALGGELGLSPYLGDNADDTTTSLLLAATFRM